MLDELRRGFEVLLGRPLDTFETNARYEVWFFVDSELLPESERVACEVSARRSAGAGDATGR